MSDLSTTLTDEEKQQIAQKDDFHIAPYREDGETFGTLTWIWVVEVEGELYVRAYNGTSSSWYQSAIEQKAGKIEAAGMEKKVRFEPVKGESINDKIDEAYKDKYSGSPYLSPMISERARAATVKVLPGN
ncbi:DUF2255 family protein [Gracilimonas mengyeensis]|uniref:DUF2255 family protein n=1 Tax=Gracilimonas mengyeensis TaxID=1302730 RepID=A0A521D0S1_9BACT|nr:DUF2255 family protein [Gracilimonas mengyeensis]SMO65289.1 hypothetical protein SAMN06265219_1076 [Gracilimonas mengyeensis]